MSTQPGQPSFSEPPPLRSQTNGSGGSGVSLALGGCAMIAVVMIAVVAWFVWAAGSLLKDDGALKLFTKFMETEVTTQAIQRASRDPRASKILGAPITSDSLWSGKVSSHNSDGSADVSVPLKGPKHDGTIHAIASKTSGSDWVFSKLVVTIKGTKETIDLLQTPVSPPAEAPIQPPP